MCLRRVKEAASKSIKLARLRLILSLRSQTMQNLCYRIQTINCLWLFIERENRKVLSLPLFLAPLVRMFSFWIIGHVGLHWMECKTLKSTIGLFWVAVISTVQDDKSVNLQSMQEGSRADGHMSLTCFTYVLWIHRHVTQGDWRGSSVH